MTGVGGQRPAAATQKADMCTNVGKSLGRGLLVILQRPGTYSSLVFPAAPEGSISFQRVRLTSRTRLVLSCILV